jgi:predicted TIM-barrel fold metal-dependent hydrolase
VGKKGEPWIAWPTDYYKEMYEPFTPPGEKLPDVVYDGESAEEAVKLHDKAGVDKFVALAALSEGVPNDYVSMIKKKYPDKIIGFASVNPNIRMPRGPDRVVACVKELERAIKGLDLDGLKLYPTYENWSPDDFGLVGPVYEKAEELDIPVTIHQAWTTISDARMRYAHPYLLDDVARNYKNLKIIVAHFGLPWVDETICLITKNRNMYTDLSWWLYIASPKEVLETLLKCPRYGCSYDKLIWATDNWGTISENITMISDINKLAEKLDLPKIPEKAIDKILGENFAKILGIN